MTKLIFLVPAVLVGGGVIGGGSYVYSKYLDIFKIAHLSFTKLEGLSRQLAYCFDNLKRTVEKSTQKEDLKKLFKKAFLFQNAEKILKHDILKDTTKKSNLESKKTKLFSEIEELKKTLNINAENKDKDLQQLMSDIERFLLLTDQIYDELIEFAKSAHKTLATLFPNFENEWSIKDENFSNFVSFHEKIAFINSSLGKKDVSKLVIPTELKPFDQDNLTSFENQKEVGVSLSFFKDNFLDFFELKTTDKTELEDLIKVDS